MSEYLDDKAAQAVFELDRIATAAEASSEGLDRLIEAVKGLTVMVGKLVEVVRNK